MGLRRQAFVYTTDGSGAASVQSPQPISGYVQEIRQNSANSNFGGSVDYTFTRPAEEGGGTIVALSNTPGPFSVYTGGSVSSGGPSASFWGVPCDGHLTMTVAQGGASIAGTVHVYYNGDC